MSNSVIFMVGMVVFSLMIGYVVSVISIIRKMADRQDKVSLEVNRDSL